MQQHHPRLRYLEALHHTHDGNPVIVLRDPLQISDAVLMVPPALYPFLTLLDGTNSIPDIQKALTEQTGQPVSEHQIVHLVDQFDRAGFLHNARFRRLYRELLEQFRSSSLRKAVHAGISYPNEAAELQSVISTFYTDINGAGLPGDRAARSLKGLVAPHIDLRLGGPTYTHAYRVLAESEPPDLFVILGTGHHGLPELFSISRKDFETPLGLAKTDQDLLRLLDETLRPDRFREDLTHRTEHTIEFQIPFLQHLLPHHEFRILPVLCSFSFEQLRGSETLEDDRRFEAFVGGLQSALQRLGKRVCFIASIDLAHIGPRYGDPKSPDSKAVDKVLRLDRQMLEPASAGDPVGFFDFVADERDRRRICGFSPLYTMLSLLEGEPGRLLAHHQSQMDGSGSFVSYASMAFDGTADPGSLSE